MELGPSVGTIHWFALESGPQNGSSFLLETGEWVNRVTCLNSVKSCRFSRALEMMKSSLGSLVMLESSGLVGKVLGCLATKFSGGVPRTALSLIG